MSLLRVAAETSFVRAERSTFFARLFGVDLLLSLHQVSKKSFRS